MKSLIIYFSRAGENYEVGYIDKGNTEVVAEIVKELTGSDIFKVEPAVPYSKEYLKCLEEAQDRIGNAPVKELPNITNYELIYIMTPIYWNTFAPEIETVLKTVNFVGKTIRIVTTHEGSGIGEVLNDIKKLCMGANIDSNTLSIYGSKVYESREVIEKWI